MIAIPSVDLRLLCSQYVYQQLNSILIPLTQTVIEIMVDYSSPPTPITSGEGIKDGNEKESTKEVIWTACTIKELLNQPTRMVYPWSEKIYYLFKMIMVSVFPYQVSFLLCNIESYDL